MSNNLNFVNHNMAIAITSSNSKNSATASTPRSEIRDLMSTDLKKRITHPIEFKLEVCFYLKFI